MPLKEIIALTMTIVGAWYMVGGQKGVLRNIRKAQILVLREVGKTSHWGNPAPWKYRKPRIRR